MICLTWSQCFVAAYEAKLDNIAEIFFFINDAGKEEMLQG